MMIPYKLIRSKRKTIAVSVTKEAAVEVRAPMRAPVRYIEGFLEEKEKWIGEQLMRRREELFRRESFSVGEGDRLLLLGREYPVRLLKGCKAPLFDGEGFLLPAQGFEENKPLLIALYQKIALDHIAKRVEFYSGVVGATPLAVKVGKANTRWGSCSGKNSLNFSWKLILAPKEAVDYVVVHELCHILQHNHSPRFWKEVERVLPDYRQREGLLQKLQKRLSEENW